VLSLDPDDRLRPDIPKHALGVTAAHETDIIEFQAVE
jgi:hypothetical protein